MSSSVTNASGRISRAEETRSPAEEEASDLLVVPALVPGFPEGQLLEVEGRLVQALPYLSVAELELLVRARKIRPLEKHPHFQGWFSLVVYFFLHLWPMSNAPKNLQISFYQAQ